MINRCRWLAMCWMLTAMAACGRGQEPIASKVTVDRDVSAIAKVRKGYASTWKVGSADRLAGYMRMMAWSCTRISSP